MATYTPFWNNLFGTTLSYQQFFGFIGASKLFGVASMWARDSKLGLMALLTPTMCALYMHKEQGDPYVQCVVMGAACSYLLLTDPEKGSSGMKKE